MSRVFLFWENFVLTRSLGATVGDLLDKPVARGGTAFSRPLASVVLAGFILVCPLVLPQRVGGHPEASALRRHAADPVMLSMMLLSRDQQAVRARRRFGFDLVAMEALLATDAARRRSSIRLCAMR